MPNTENPTNRKQIIDSEDLQEITAEEMEALLSEADAEIEEEKNAAKG